MNEIISKDIIIVGGGLAGLALSILCAQDGRKTTVIEKQNYPKHKVCGEYLSNESVPFLERLGLNLDLLGCPQIQNFILTTEKTKAQCVLKPGGIGISRYTLDSLLYKTALDNGVEFILDTRVVSIENKDKSYIVKTTHQDNYSCNLAIGAFGRTSGLDQKLSHKTAQFLGIKYHVEQGPPTDTIEIHHFKGGYCGISAIENNQYCMCYLIKADLLKEFKSDIQAMENSILSQNPYLKERMNTAKLMGPITTSQFNFGTSKPMYQSYPLLGDAAGFIPPITGNGMSLALRSAQYIYQNTSSIGQGSQQWHQSYDKYTNNYLKFRINKGILLQNILLMHNESLMDGIMWSLKNIPGAMPFMVKQAVGKPF